jgi:hypothetical protein
MRLHIKNLSPYCHGIIAEDKAEHDHKNQQETVECIIKRFAEMKAYLENLEKEDNRNVVVCPDTQRDMDVNGYIQHCTWCIEDCGHCKHPKIESHNPKIRED